MLDNRASTMICGEFDAPTPRTSLTHERYETMLENGMDHNDNSGLLRVVERLGGTEARVDGS